MLNVVNVQLNGAKCQIQLEKICNYVFLAYCPRYIRMLRVLKRRDMDKATLDKIFKLQMPDSLKIKKSNFIINTSKKRADTNKQIVRALKKIFFTIIPFLVLENKIFL